MVRLSHLSLSFIATFAAQMLGQGAALAADETALPAEIPIIRAADPAPPAADSAALTELASPDGLTADQVAERVMLTSPSLQSDAEESAAQAHAVSQARAAFIPRITQTLRYTRVSDTSGPSLGNLVVAPADVAPGPIPDGTPLAAVPLAFPAVVNQYEAQTSLEVPLSDYVFRLPQLYAAAKKSARAAVLVQSAHRLRAASEARVAYYDWLRARLQQRVAERTLARTETHLADVRTARELGTASQADVLSVEARVANAELSLARATRAVEVQHERLRISMHNPVTTSYRVGETLPAPAAADAAPGSVDGAAYLRRALHRRLELRTLLENAGSLRDQADSALASELPRLSGVAGFSYSRPNSRILPATDEFQSSWEAGVRLTWTPTDIFGAAAGQSSTLARARKIDAERDELADAIALEVKNAVAARDESTVALRTTERALASAAEAYRVRRELFKNGRATSAELTDAETDWSNAQLDAVSARADRQIAEVELRHAVGDDVQ